MEMDNWIGDRKMKKRMIIVAVIFGLAGALTACGGSASNETTQTSDAQATEDVQLSSDENDAATENESDGGMSDENSWVEATSEDYTELLGYDLTEILPDEATDIVNMINKSIGLAEIRFNCDGLDFCLRAEEGELDVEEISGLSYEWGWIVDSPVLINGSYGKFCKYEDPDDKTATQVCIWHVYGSDFTYSLSTQAENEQVLSEADASVIGLSEEFSKKISEI